MDGERLPTLGPRGEGWFAIQLLLFAAIALAGETGPAWSGNLRVAGDSVGLAAIALGGLLAVRGVLDLRESLTPFPRPLARGRLKESGAYGLVRHPIYGGLVVAALGWSVATAAPLAFAASLLLLAFFDLKSRREEVWLAERYQTYDAYRSRTHRLLPWLY